MNDVTVQVTIGDQVLTDTILGREVEKTGLLGCLIQSATRINTSVKARPDLLKKKAAPRDEPISTAQVTEAV